MSGKSFRPSVMNQKGSIGFSSLILLEHLAVLNYFFIDDVIPWGESEDNNAPNCSVNRCYIHFITSLKRCKDEKQHP